MRLAIAILVTVMTGTVAQAQSREGSTGPFTGYEAATMSEVWPKIREAAHFDDINYESAAGGATRPSLRRVCAAPRDCPVTWLVSRARA